MKYTILLILGMLLISGCTKIEVSPMQQCMSECRDVNCFEVYGRGWIGSMNYEDKCYLNNTFYGYFSYPNLDKECFDKCRVSKQ